MERRSLPVQTAEAILAHLGKGGWTGWLPGERKLGQVLQVSRGTVRSALAILRQRKLLTVVPSRGYRLAAQPAKRRRSETGVTLSVLSSEPLELKRPYFALMLGQIREEAQARGWKVMQHHGAHFFGAHAEANLARLVSTFPASCWILVLSTRRAQQWFERSRLPVLVSGHTYEGVALPSLDVNHRAGGRHAAALLARAGHTRIVVIRSQRRLPGLVEGELGFEEGFESATAGQGRIFPIIFNGNPASLALHLARVLNDRPAPTAVVTEEPNQYLTVLSALARLRLVVPGDLSVLSRLDDPFLEHLVPAPTRYRISPVTFARTLIRMAAHTAAGDVLPSRRRLIVPEFVPGGSVAPVPRSAASDGGDAT